MNRVGLITALPQVELPAALLAFGIPVDAPPTNTPSGLRCWTTRITHQQSGPLEVVITSLSQSGNTESSITTEKFISSFSPELIVLVGIGCGTRSFALGDVATADVVWAYEYLKTAPTGALDRSRAQTAPRFIRDDLLFFNKTAQWASQLASAVKTVPSHFVLPRTIPEKPALRHDIWVASGEKVMANGELNALNKIHDNIRVGEMEGYGFARACDGHRPPIPWMIARGISDYGDKTKDGEPDPTAPLKDEYHFFAALSAATFARCFLEHGYTFEPETKDGTAAGSDILDTFSSANDPRFGSTLRTALESCQSEAVFIGMGLAFMKSNRELFSVIGKRLTATRTLRVRIYYCDPTNKGLRNRVDEEANYALQERRPYNKSWPKDHLQSLLSSLRSEVPTGEAARIAVYLTSALPMLCVAKIDDLYFWFPYGTPNIRGKESPWILVRGDRPESPLRRFLDKIIAYVSSPTGSHPLQPEPPAPAPHNPIHSERPKP